MEIKTATQSKLDDRTPTPEPFRVAVKYPYPTQPNLPYADIIAGRGFLNKELSEGFNVGGIVRPVDARMLAASRRMFDLLERIERITDAGQPFRIRDMELLQDILDVIDEIRGPVPVVIDPEIEAAVAMAQGDGP